MMIRCGWLSLNKFFRYCHVCLESLYYSIMLDFSV